MLRNGNGNVPVLMGLQYCFHRYYFGPYRISNYYHKNTVTEYRGRKIKDWEKTFLSVGKSDIN